MQKTESILNSPADCPLHFAIIISESGNRNNSLAIEVKGKDIINHSEKICSYEIHNRKQSSYLDLFEKLSKDFGLHIPKNRKPEILHHFTAAYHELLTKNLVPEILYGYGDPAVLRIDSENKAWYYLLSTSNDAPDSFPILRSNNLYDWEFTGFVFPKGNKPEWAADEENIADYWAPEMHKIGNEFRIYFAARHKQTLELCIGMATSLHPEGPYIADAEPILKGNKIDPHVFVENDNAILYWKEDNNALWPNLLIDLLYNYPKLIILLFNEKDDQATASFMLTLWPWVQKLRPMEAFLVQQTFIETVTGSFLHFKERLVKISHAQPQIQKNIAEITEAMRTKVYAQKLSANGSALIGEPMFIFENDQPWEAHLVEGMWVTKYNNRYYLFYSGNDFSTDEYGIGAAIGNSAYGPFKKIPEPILSSTEKWRAPGHPSVTVGQDGKHYLLLHAYPGKAGYKEFRALLSIPVRFDSDKILINK